jgi:hypothetical protein
LKGNTGAHFDAWWYDSHFTYFERLNKVFYEGRYGLRLTFPTDIHLVERGPVGSDFLVASTPGVFQYVNAPYATNLYGPMDQEQVMINNSNPETTFFHYMVTLRSLGGA